MERVNIAFGVTEDWLQYTRVTVASILKNADSYGDFHFYIMVNSITDEEKEKFERLKAIHDCEFNYFLMDDEEFKPLVRYEHLGTASLYRLKLPELLKEPKALYLDSDIIVNENILELYMQDVSDYYLGAVEDKCSDAMRPRCNLDENHKFFNSGVLLMNLDMFRKDNLQEILIEKIRKKYYYIDQDALNDVCRDKWLSLRLKFNFMPVEFSIAYWGRRREASVALNNPFVVHFTQKPWKNPDVVLSELWFKYKEIAESC